MNPTSEDPSSKDETLSPKDDMDSGSGNPAASNLGRFRIHPIIRFWLPLAGWAGVILFLTSQPGGGVPKFKIPHLDWVAHVVLYAGLGALAYRALFWGMGLRGRVAWMTAIGGAIVFGVLDEIHQFWIPDRYCSFGDMVADAIGVVIGVVVYWRLMVRDRNRQ